MAHYNLGICSTVSLERTRHSFTFERRYGLIPACRIAQQYWIDLDEAREAG